MASQISTGLPGGIPPYPGNPQINALPGEQFNPIFDGTFARGTQTVPSLNALFDDVNSIQTAIFAPTPQNPAGLGYGALPPSSLPPFGATTPPANPAAPAGTHAAANNGVHNQSINHSA